MIKQLSFSNVKLKDLRNLVDLSPNIDNTVFDKWLTFDYSVSSADEAFLVALIQDHAIRIPYYSEEELKMKFIAPLLNRVDFTFDEVTDWYERPIGAVVNGCELKGATDYLVAKGISEPELPYFFIQEFKPSRRTSDPEDQLLAELLVAIYLGEVQEMLGMVIVGQLWTFLLLRRLEEDRFQYYKSVGFNVLNIEDLKKLYVSLQGVKADIVVKASS